MLPNIKLTQLSKEEFFGMLFQIRNQMHLQHLKVEGIGSYAQHKALSDFYSEILDLTDSLIEAYQGKYGILNITIPKASAEDSIQTIEKLVNLTDGGSAYSLFKETWIKNELDTISKLCYETIYKLKFLK